MAIYRNVQLSFWTDNKVEDEFTPEDKYFYLYLLTNPQTNICGCYEVSYNQTTRQTGYKRATIEKLIERLDKVHNVIKFDKKTKEILILHWYKYNWSKSKDTIKGVRNTAEYIKSDDFKKYVLDIVSGLEKEGAYRPPIAPRWASVSDTDSVTDTDTDSVTDAERKKKKMSKEEIMENLLTEFNLSDYLKESIDEWIEYKKERGFAYKERGMKNLIKTISEKSKTYGDQAVVLAITESISNGYQGIVWEKIEKRQKVQSNKPVDWTNV